MATICTEADVDLMAGANASTEVTLDQKESLIEQAESFLTDLVKYDIVANWSELTENYKKIFEEYAARYTAVQVITYDMSTFGTLTAATNMINTHWARMKEIQSLLEDEDKQDFIGV